MISIFTQSNFSFDSQRDDEKVSLFLYRHWIVIVLPLFFMAFSIIFPIIPLFFLSKFILVHHLESLVFFFLILFYILIWSSAFFSITMYLLDTWIVTDTRVLDMTQHGFFSRTISEMSLSKVQDISVKVEGVIPTMFGYGNIEIETAGAVEKFIFKQVPHPNQVKDQIMDLVKGARQEEKKEGL